MTLIFKYLKKNYELKFFLLIIFGDFINHYTILNFTTEPINLKLDIKSL